MDDAPVTDIAFCPSLGDGVLMMDGFAVTGISSAGGISQGSVKVRLVLCGDSGEHTLDLCIGYRTADDLIAGLHTALMRALGVRP